MVLHLSYLVVFSPYLTFKLTNLSHLLEGQLLLQFETFIQAELSSIERFLAHLGLSLLILTNLLISLHKLLPQSFQLLYCTLKGFVFFILPQPDFKQLLLDPCSCAPGAFKLDG